MSKTIEISRELAKAIEDLLACPQHHVRSEYISAYTELRAMLAAPAVERQEPVAYRWRHHANPIYADRKVWEPITLALGAVYLERKARAAANNNRYPEDVYYSELELEPLHTSPPAPVAAVLPERMEDDHDPWNVGWNRCLDEIKELNQ